MLLLILEGIPYAQSIVTSASGVIVDALTSEPHRFLYQYFSPGDILEMLHGPADEGFDVGHQ